MDGITWKALLSMSDAPHAILIYHGIKKSQWIPQTVFCFDMASLGSTRKCPFPIVL